MSLGVPSLKTQAVLEPRLNIDSIRRYNILRGGKNISWKPVQTTSNSTSSIQITAPPPNPAIIVDREIYFMMSGRLNFTGVVTEAGNPRFLRVGQTDSLRAYPFSNGILQTLQVTINNTSVSINMNDIIEPLLRYNVPEFKRGKIFSMSPSCQDQFQEFAFWQSGNTTISKLYTANQPDQSTIIQGNGTGARNALGAYGNISGDEMARGGFATLSVQSNAIDNNNVGTAVVDFLICEPIFLSPMLFGGEGAGFIGEHKYAEVY